MSPKTATKPRIHSQSFERSPIARPASRGKQRPKGRIRFLRKWTLKAAPYASVLLGSGLLFGFSSAARDWILGALGYGLIPVTTWIVLFLLVLRDQRQWIQRFRRVWVGTAWLAALSLGALSLVKGSSGVLGDASFGGYWGQYLGGTPMALGIVKLLVIGLLGPILVFPRRASALYANFAWKALRRTGLGARWLWMLIVARLRSRPAALDVATEESLEQAPPKKKKPWKSVFSTSSEAGSEVDEPEFDGHNVKQSRRKEKGSGWQLPSPEMLSKGETTAVPQGTLQEMAKTIEGTLSDHRVEVVVEDIRTGPRVVRFGLVPGWVKKYREMRGVRAKDSDDEGIEMSRVKVQSILMREKDLALALKTAHVRMEAPVPGEALVGLEVPNPNQRRVALRSVSESPIFQKIAARGGLPVALGEDTGGEPVVADLSDLPHLLIAGATGSGKSVCINAIVGSLLLTVPPDKLRMLMVDPKRVELTPFNGIPHLIAPVIVETDQVLVVLRAIQTEMLRRFKLLEQTGVRNIDGYNKKAQVRMPYLVIVIDELADLMMAAAYEVEQALVRLAQLGRATGIHLMLATQRPSVNVVTGLLKANIPSRVAFAVASQVDSRVILDSVGAERLLGKGDMLLQTHDSPKPKRVQGTFVHDKEIEKLVEFWQAQSGPPLPEIQLDEPEQSDTEEEEDIDEEMLELARDLATRHSHISSSLLQRRLHIGYAKAVQLKEILEDEGLILQSS